MTEFTKSKSFGKTNQIVQVPTAHRIFTVYSKHKQ